MRESPPQRVKCKNPWFIPCPFLYANSQCFFLFLFVLSKKILMDVASMLAARTAVTSTLNYCNVFFLESSVSR